jgi:hypothetical protein
MSITKLYFNELANLEKKVNELVKRIDGITGGSHHADKKDWELIEGKPVSDAYRMTGLGDLIIESDTLNLKPDILVKAGDKVRYISPRKIYSIDYVVGYVADKDAYCLVDTSSGFVMHSLFIKSGNGTSVNLNEFILNDDDISNWEVIYRNEL